LDDINEWYNPILGRHSQKENRLYILNSDDEWMIYIKRDSEPPFCVAASIYVLSHSQVSFSLFHLQQKSPIMKKIYLH